MLLTNHPSEFNAWFAKWLVTDVPFELIDVIPELLRDPDAHLQHLAAQSPAEIEGFEDIAGDSRAIRDAVGRAKRAAIRSVAVLLVGESGTGKEMFAQAIHHLFAAMQKGEFREDLYYRLAGISIRLPPLRDRKSDLPNIAERLLGTLNREFEADQPGYEHKSLSAAAITFVKSQPWRGNVRQLYNGARPAIHPTSANC